MSNEFNIKNGFISKGDGLINGGLTAQTLTITSGATNGYVLTSNASGNVTWKDPNSILPYKVYTALLTRNGAAAPTEIVLQNTIGTITFSYNTIGNYRVNSAALFTTNKTTVFITQEINGAFGNVLTASPTSSSVIVISQTNSGGSNDDDWSWPVSIEIRVYP